VSNRRRITSVKPGRAPSFMGGVGSILAIVFGIVWTAMAFQLTRHSPFGGIVSIFPLFGVLFIVMGVISAIYNFRQATQKNRYSVLDIADSDVEPDPLNERFGPMLDAEFHVESDSHADEDGRDDRPHRFCPYCGDDIGEEFRYCPSCGKELPE
jgi:hypothetical protein